MDMLLTRSSTGRLRTDHECLPVLLGRGYDVVGAVFPWHVELRPQCASNPGPDLWVTRGRRTGTSVLHPLLDRFLHMAIPLG